MEFPKFKDPFFVDNVDIGDEGLVSLSLCLPFSLSLLDFALLLGLFVSSIHIYTLYVHDVTC